MKKRILLILLAGVMLVAMLAMTLASCTKEEEPDDPDVTPPEGEKIEETITIPGITPDYPLPPVDEEAEDAVDGDDKMDVESGNTGAALEWSSDVKVTISNKSASLYVRNPSRSLQNISLQLVVKDQVVGESGLILPGKRLTTMEIKDGAFTQSGVFSPENAKLVVRYYDPTTNACAIVTTDIQVTVTVVE